MSNTPRGAPELVSAQATPESTVNRQIRHTEVGACHFPVADRTTAPPGSCADGANYIVTATATGAWTGKENQIATAFGTNAANGWLYHTPAEGFTAYVQDENTRYLFDGSAWGIDTTGGSFSTASTTEQLTGTDSSKGATPDSVAALWEQGSDVASAGTVSLGEGGYFVVTGTTTITDIDFATDKAGRKAWVKFAGILTLTHGANLILPTGASITTAAGDTACFVSEGSDVVRCVAYQRANGQALAGSGGSPIIQGTHSIPINAAAMIPNTTNGPAAGTTESTTNKVMISTLDFDQSTDESAQITLAMPKSWDEGTITAQFCWTATTTGNVVWGCAGVALSDDDALDTAFGTAQTVTDGVTAAGDVMWSAATSAITIAGTPAAEDLVVLKFYRDADNGSDTLAADAKLIAVRIKYTINAGDDS